MPRTTEAPSTPHPAEDDVQSLHRTLAATDLEGEAFLDFQHRLRALQAPGVLLAVCRKNNPAEQYRQNRERRALADAADDLASYLVVNEELVGRR